MFTFYFANTCRDKRTRRLHSILLTCALQSCTSLKLFTSQMCLVTYYSQGTMKVSLLYINVEKLVPPINTKSWKVTYRSQWNNVSACVLNCVLLPFLDQLRLVDRIGFTLQNSLQVKSKYNTIDKCLVHILVVSFFYLSSVLVVQISYLQRCTLMSMPL